MTVWEVIKKILKIIIVTILICWCIIGAVISTTFIYFGVVTVDDVREIM